LQETFIVVLSTGWRHECTLRRTPKHSRLSQKDPTCPHSNGFMRPVGRYRVYFAVRSAMAICQGQ